MRVPEQRCLSGAKRLFKGSFDEITEGKLFTSNPPGDEVDASGSGQICHFLRLWSTDVKQRKSALCDFFINCATPHTQN